jgi:hypothetical protein
MVADRSRLGNGTYDVGTRVDSGDDLTRAGHRSTSLRFFAWVVLTFWLVLILGLGAKGAFPVPAGTPPYPIVIGVAAPILVFLAAVWVSSTFRSFVMAADLPLLTALQAWRFAGFGFLALFAHGVLPGVFAWPAGLGDMAIGLTAPWVALTVARRPGFSASWLFVIWNLLGILDLIGAVGSAAVNQMLAIGAAGEVTVAPMAQLPLLLVPAFLVPLFVIWHLTALFQSRRLVLMERSGNPA